MNNLILNSLVNYVRPLFAGKLILDAFASYSGITLRTEADDLFFSLVPEAPLLLSCRQKPITTGPLPAKGGKIKHALLKGTIESIEKQPDDRITHIKIKGASGRLFNLYYLGIPNRVELVMTDQNDVILTRTHLSWEQEETYTPQLRESPESFSRIETETLEEILSEIAREGYSGPTLMQKVSGMDRNLSSEILRIFASGEPPLETLITILQNQAYNLVVTEPENQEDIRLLPEVFSLDEENQPIRFEDDNEAAMHFFRKKARLYELSRIMGEINPTISSRTKKIKTIRKKLQQDMDKAVSNLDIGQMGDLILANMHLLKRGMDSIEVLNYYSETGETIVIKLDPVISPPENAEKYYKKAKKAKRGVKALKQRLKDQEKQETILNELKTRIEEAVGNLKELRKIHKDMVARKWITQAQKKRLKIKTLPGKRFVSSQGYEIIVGKNSKENEVVSFQVGKDNDFWMHAAGCPGSHVVLKNPERKDDPPERSLYEAAAIAAHYSKAKNSTNVQVHWTKRRFIKKVKGGAPGKVTLSAYSSVLVNPEIPKGVKVAE